MFDESGWVNKIITAGIIAMIGWTLLTVQDVSVELAVLKSKFDGLEQQISLTTRDRYTRAESVADRALLEQRLARLEEWNGRLSDRLNTVEDAVTRLDNSQR